MHALRNSSSLLDSVEASLGLSEAPDGSLGGPNVEIAGYHRLFGGQLLAQGLVAAGGRVPDMSARSIHMVFVAEGRPTEPVRWEAEDIRRGRSFATIMVRGRQVDRDLAVALVSLHAAETGVEHQVPTPRAARPDDLRDLPPAGAMPFHMRVAGDVALDGSGVGPPELAVFMRPPRPLGTSAQLRHQALLAYCSDTTMMAVAMRPHEGVGFGSPVLVGTAVTSHTVSFHRPFSLDGWSLFSQHSPVAAGGGAYIRGDWFDAGGLLVASCAQEAVIRTVAGA